MKTTMKIMMSAVAILLTVSCATMNDSSNDYFGYTNNPSYSAPESNVATTAAPAPVNTAHSEYDDQSYYTAPSYANETVVERHYVYFNPIVHHGYYPWWAPQRRWNVVHHRPTVSFGFSYSNYSIWDSWYYNHYYPQYYPHYNYGYNSVYYPYPVYSQPYYGYPGYYGAGWYSNPRRYRPENPRSNDTYRDFGPSRGSYGYTGSTPETTPPANRRSGSGIAPTSDNDTRTIYDRNAGGSNTRTGTSTPTRENIGTESPVRSTTPANTSPRGVSSGNEGGNIRSNAPANTRTPSRENISAPSGREASQPQRSPNVAPAPSSNTPQREAAPAPRSNTPSRQAAPAPRSNTPSRQAAPAPRQSTPQREAAPSRSSTPSRESSRPSNERSSEPNRRTR